MKKIISTCLLSYGILFADIALAESYSPRAGGSRQADNSFQEKSEPLPPIPDAKQGDWFDLYISPVFKGQPRILLSSLHFAEDGSIRYLLNNRSAAHYDNISAEGIQCSPTTSLLDSEPSKFKTFAFADPINARWIETRKAQWLELGGKNPRHDPVRQVIMDAFCREGKARNNDELHQQIRDFAGSKPRYR